MEHVMMENRNGVLVEAFLTEANGRAERDAALLIAEAIPPGERVMLGGDKNYDTRETLTEVATPILLTKRSTPFGVAAYV
jgi:hypothetical protein